MVRRRKIGLLFDDYGEHWTGGEYYLLNIVRSLQFLKGPLPQLIIFYSSPNIIDKVKELNYKGPINFMPVEKPVLKHQAFFNRLAKKILDIDLHIGCKYRSWTTDFIFPCINIATKDSLSLKNLRKVYWIPDFQHKYLPHFFSPEEVQQLDNNLEELSKLNATIVFSSNNARNDFLRFYPNSKAPTKVIQFASVLPRFKHIQFEELKRKFALKDTPFFISPNQFWAHKNHLVILKAVMLLKKTGLRFQVLFTGKENDYRNPQYIQNLKDYAKENKIEDCVVFLGFIDRAEQLQLMAHAQAVIQPSLFEGWSTVVEDAKALNKVLVLSDLEVHKEQCGVNGNYFPPENATELASLLKKVLDESQKHIPIQYEDNIKKFANDLLSI